MYRLDSVDGGDPAAGLGVISTSRCTCWSTKSMVSCVTAVAQGNAPLQFVAARGAPRVSAIMIIRRVVHGREVVVVHRNSPFTSTQGVVLRMYRSSNSGRESEIHPRSARAKKSKPISCLRCVLVHDMHRKLETCNDTYNRSKASTGINIAVYCCSRDHAVVSASSIQLQM